MELQYDGTGLHGWAKQEGLPTVSGSLEEALRTVLGEAPVLRVAGRTDAGVHARRQVVSLCLPERSDLSRLSRSLNALTPAGIAVLVLRPAPAVFDARKDATSRSYRYFLSTDPVVSPFWARYCWHVHGDDLDLRTLNEAAALVVGRHPFTAFTPAETEHVFFDRTVVRCRWTRVAGPALPAALPGGLSRSGAARAGRGNSSSGAARAGGVLCLEIEAEAFLRHMVRTLVGTMMEVGRGERSLDDFRRLLDGAPREAAGPTAPPQGLFLWDIKYGHRGTDRPSYGRISAETSDESGDPPANSEA
jgi:tRNA pseudouridine38-40 synthase